MIRNKGLALLLAGSILTGCQLDTSYDVVENTNAESNTETEGEVTSVENTETEAESTPEEMIVTLPGEAQSVIESMSEQSKAEQNMDNIKDMVLPTNEDGEWEDYILGIGEKYHHQFITDEVWNFGEYGVTYDIDNFPVIFVHNDVDAINEANAKMVEYAINNFTKRFQMVDLNVQLECTVHNENSRFVSYEIAGTIYHPDDTSPYQDEKEYRYYFTIDRTSMERISLSVAYGINNVKEAISAGKYEVVRADKKLFDVFNDELLARAYIQEPMFIDDDDHYLDFYFDDGRLCVCIWVGDDLGGYAVLKLEGTPKLIKEKDKSVGTASSKETVAEDKTDEESAEEDQTAAE